MASQLQGIQHLLQAEKWAAEKVSKAGMGKKQRLKQAKVVTQAEIEQYRLQREKEAKGKEARALGSLEQNRCSVGNTQRNGRVGEPELSQQLLQDACALDETPDDEDLDLILIPLNLWPPSMFLLLGLLSWGLFLLDPPADKTLKMAF
ncbi:V-type proton ATPase subunit G 1 [Tupaia chinensis]|uniref:V-type proton ATPase subunit G n=1 Tax=Tupaia chinensis TaxID=246437 RepID=L9KVD7_TUPCH|nr:V-type proton ATPase subunit G 1 [Tupaia chinensis]